MIMANICGWDPAEIAIGADVVLQIRFQSALCTSQIIGNPDSLCVTRDITQVNYREHMRQSLGLKICWKMEMF